MPLYRATVHSEAAGLAVREIEAGSLADAHASLRDAGFRILAIAEPELLRGRLRARRAGSDHVRFVQNVHTLLDAGLSITEVLQALAKQGDGGEAETARRALLALRDGKRLSAALGEALDDAPELLLGLIRASEQTGNVGEALGRYVAYREKVDAVRKRLVTALIYPCLLVAVGGLVIVFLLGFVVPRFATAYEGVVHDIAFMSRLIVQWGSLVQAHGSAMILAVFAALLLAGTGIRSLVRRGGPGALVAWHPTLRARSREYALSRLYRTIGLQVLGGIPVVRALEAAADLLHGNDREALAVVVAKLRAGSSLTKALTDHGLASPVVSDLVRVGEQSGALGARLVRIADLLDDSVSRWMESFTRLFEPLVMLGLGVFVAAIVVLLYLPIFELAENIR